MLSRNIEANQAQHQTLLQQQGQALQLINTILEGTIDIHGVLRLYKEINILIGSYLKFTFPSKNDNNARRLINLLSDEYAKLTLHMGNNSNSVFPANPLLISQLGQDKLTQIITLLSYHIVLSSHLHRLPMQLCQSLFNPGTFAPNHINLAFQTTIQTILSTIHAYPSYIIDSLDAIHPDLIADTVCDHIAQAIKNNCEKLPCNIGATATLDTLSKNYLAELEQWRVLNYSLEQACGDTLEQKFDDVVRLYEEKINLSFSQLAMYTQTSLDNYKDALSNAMTSTDIETSIEESLKFKAKLEAIASDLRKISSVYATKFISAFTPKSMEINALIADKKAQLASIQDILLSTEEMETDDFTKDNADTFLVPKRSNSVTDLETIQADDQMEIITSEYYENNRNSDNLDTNHNSSLGSAIAMFNEPNKSGQSVTSDMSLSKSTAC
jgi:hypothetical protein